MPPTYLPPHSNPLGWYRAPKTCPRFLHYSSLQELRLIPLPWVRSGFSELLLVNHVTKMMVCNFWDRVTEDSLQFPWIICPAEVLLTCLEDTQAALWRDHVARNRGPLPTAVWWVTLEVDPAAPVKPSDDATLADSLSGTLGEPWAKPTQLSHCWSPDPQKQGNDKSPCFNLVTCGAICYTTMDSECLCKDEISFMCSRRMDAYKC